MQQTLTPVASQERIQAIDIIRALALLGVVIANFTVDNRYVTPAEGKTGFFDQLVYWPIKFFIDDKAMAMYCFLFGLGFAIQMLRAQTRKAPFIFIHIRRMIVLFVIGIGALILTNETIPHEYAMVGLLLLLFYKLPKNILPLLAILCMVIPFTRNLIIQQKAASKVNSKPVVSVDTSLLNKYAGVYQIPSGIKMIILRDGNALVCETPWEHLNLPGISDSEFYVKGNTPIFSFHKDSTGMINKMLMHLPHGKITTCARIQTDLQQALKKQIQSRSPSENSRTSFIQFIKTNSQNIWTRFKNWSWSGFFWGTDITDIFSYFLFGLYVGHRRIFLDVPGNKQFLEKVKFWGFTIGVIGMAINLGFEAWNFINDIDSGSYPIVTRTWIWISWSFGVMAMTFAYVAGLALLLENDAWKKRLSFLAPVGRMGFTNYLLQTIPYVLLFESFGINLSGQIGPFYRLLLVIPVYVLLIFISRWWFKHFSIGPVEWLWRSLTYLKFQPMRLKDSNN